MSAVIAVHQVGKVGSTSVVDTLRDLLPGEIIHQTHMLSERRMLDALRRWLGRSRCFPNFRIQENMLSSIELSRSLVQGLSQHDWYLMTMVREPIARNVSALFQNLRRVWAHHLPSRERALCLRLLEPDAETEPEAVREVAAALVTHFTGRYPQEFVDQWFDEEMKGVFGIDVFEAPFSSSGWQIYRQGTVRLLLVRLEDMAGAFDPGVRQWLGESPWKDVFDANAPLKLKRANDAGTKNYALLYQEFLKKLSLDASLVEREYNTRTARHFYSDEERSRFAAKWTKSPAAPKASSLVS